MQGSVDMYDAAALAHGCCARQMLNPRTRSLAAFAVAARSLVSIWNDLLPMLTELTWLTVLHELSLGGLKFASVLSNQGKAFSRAFWCSLLVT